ncbi:hypothetical protein KUTeg_017768 [Tegillarca granosa]|uniref:Uncharacterized protein n=1 Tax=Tegillarca granosa TaxID=220873 RepID=A0ABQ9ELA4_TEGGR|nr:hypothetical protein KUTeg_017768 [Tegillarca granosa]
MLAPYGGETSVYLQKETLKDFSPKLQIAFWREVFACLQTVKPFTDKKVEVLLSLDILNLCPISNLFYYASWKWKGVYCFYDLINKQTKDFCTFAQMQQILGTVNFLKNYSLLTNIPKDYKKSYNKRPKQHEQYCFEYSIFDINANYKSISYPNNRIPNITPLYSSVSMEDFKSGQYHLIYAHPETLTDNKVIGKILNSKQGKEFRPAFSNLGQLTCVFAHIPHLALTATATPEDLRNLSCLFEFHEPAFVILNPDRENIFYEIRYRLPNIKKYETYDCILQEICNKMKRLHQNFSVTIVYCDNLEAIGYSYVIKPSTLKIPKFQKTEYFASTQGLFRTNETTYCVWIVQERPQDQITLGIGLNAPALSRIIHFRPPTTIEKCVQEVGPAGRGEQHATAIFNDNDIASNR